LTLRLKPVTWHAVPEAASAAIALTRQRSAGARPRRLGWLDALRGIAVLFVVFEHLSFSEFTSVRAAINPWFSPGLYGVMVFFMVSGFIVPASLERRGSVRRFWVGRVFRLYPLFVVAVLIKIVLASLHLATNTVSDAGASALAHLLMLQDLLGVTNMINVLWTLSFEMAFYLLLTLLFVAGAHRRSAVVATAFAVASLVFGAILPHAALSNSFAGTKAIATAATVMIVVGLVGAVSGLRGLRTAGAALAGGTALVLLSFNSRVSVWEAFAILAAMFTGTVMYRAERGQLSWAKAIATAGVVCLLAVISGLWHLTQQNGGGLTALYQRQWALSLLLAAATFAAGMAWRKRDMPRFLTWLGMISYSVYLIHMLMIDILVRLPWTQRNPALIVQFGATVGFVCLLLGCCALTYRFVEAPMQRIGQRVAARIEARFGPDLLGTTRSAPPLPPVLDDARPSLADTGAAGPRTRAPGLRAGARGLRTRPPVPPRAGLPGAATAARRGGTHVPPASAPALSCGATGRTVALPGKDVSCRECTVQQNVRR
jgi:peptidoglycan/LPS O-acetylase OafA/YrhL